MARVVVADDDPKQAELIRRYAVAEGHDVVVAGSGRAALDEVRSRPPDLLVLDVMMPGLNGFDVCRAMRTTPALEHVPILMVTARSAESDLIDGLDVGADDYLTKPFSPRELMARARALLRRHARESERAGSQYTVGKLTVDTRAHVALWEDAAISLTPGEFGLLLTFISEPGRAFSREQLLQRLHGVDPWVSSRTVDVHIANLRKKLDPTVIRTIYGVGYAMSDT